MHRFELTQQIHARLALDWAIPRDDLDQAIRDILAYLTDCLAQGERIEIRDFGVFTCRQRPARQGRNPRTGEGVAVPDRQLVHFKPGRGLRQQVDFCAPGVGLVVDPQD